MVFERNLVNAQKFSSAKAFETVLHYESSSGRFKGNIFLCKTKRSSKGILWSLWLCFFYKSKSKTLRRWMPQPSWFCFFFSKNCAKKSFAESLFCSLFKNFFSNRKNKDMAKINQCHFEFLFFTVFCIALSFCTLLYKVLQRMNRKKQICKKREYFRPR
jgi:hypothetical protein